MEAPSVMDAGYAVADRLMLALPSNWARAELGFFVRDGFLEVRDDVTKVLGDREAFDLPVDDLLSRALLSIAFKQLQAALEADDVDWRFGPVVVERTSDGPISLDLFDDKQVIAHLELDTGDLLFGDDLLRALHEGQQAWNERQQALRPTLADHIRWAMDLETGELELERENGDLLGARIQILGSWSARYQSWSWSWANQSYVQVPHLVSGARQLSERAESWPGQGVFCTPGFDCDAVFADALALLAAEHLGGYPVYFGRMPDLTVFMAITGPIT